MVGSAASKREQHLKPRSAQPDGNGQLLTMGILSAARAAHSCASSITRCKRACGLLMAANHCQCFRAPFEGLVGLVIGPGQEVLQLLDARGDALAGFFHCAHRPVRSRLAAERATEGGAYQGTRCPALFFPAREM